MLVLLPGVSLYFQENLQRTIYNGGPVARCAHNKRVAFRSDKSTVFDFKSKTKVKEK